MSHDEDKWVLAIVLESTATPQQRQRNYAFYERLRDGVIGDDRQRGLKQFWFEDPASGAMFRLDPTSDCYRRLCSYIVEHTDAKCDADDEVERLKSGIRAAALTLVKWAVAKGGDTSMAIVASNLRDLIGEPGLKEGVK